MKWLVVPSALALVGYFGIGPLIGGRTSPPPAASEPTSEEPARRFTSEPEVEVSATPAPRRTRARVPQRRSEPSRVRVVEPPPEPETPEEAEPPPVADPVDDHGTVPPITTTGGGDGGGVPPSRNLGAR